MRAGPSANVVVMMDRPAGAVNAARGALDEAGGDRAACRRRPGRRAARRRRRPPARRSGSAPAAEQVGGAAAEQQQAAVAEHVAADDPLQLGGGQAEVGAGWTGARRRPSTRRGRRGRARRRAGSARAQRRAIPAREDVRGGESVMRTDNTCMCIECKCINCERNQMQSHGIIAPMAADEGQRARRASGTSSSTATRGSPARWTRRSSTSTASA